jgi:hypothetical protein
LSLKSIQAQDFDEESEVQAAVWGQFIRKDSTAQESDNPYSRSKMVDPNAIYIESAAQSKMFTSSSLQARE